jgi:hypothetical protein
LSVTLNITFDDIRQSIQDTKETLKILMKEDKPENREIYISILASLVDHSNAVKKWIKDHEDLVDNPRENIEYVGAFLESVSRMQALASIPNQHSQLINMLQLWKLQRKTSWLTSDLKIANNLALSYIKFLKINLKPITVFSDEFRVIGIGDFALLAIPFAYRKSFERWPSIAHEIGHLYVKNNAIWDTESLDNLLLRRVSAAAGSNPQLSKKFDPQIIGLTTTFNLHWIQEFFADYVALSVCGFPYLTELYRLSIATPIGTVTASHPPWELRIQCALEVLSKLGMDSKRFQELMNPIQLPHPELDEIETAFAGTDFAPEIIAWIQSQKLFSKYKLSINKIVKAANEFRTGRIPDNPFHINFAALIAISFGKEDKSNLYDQLLSLL